MDTIFMNSENRKTPKPHVWVLKLTFYIGKWLLLYQILAFITHRKT